MKYAIVSGGFDPVHIGHVKLFEEAAKYGKLIVILNNDNWLIGKKGKPFMSEEERAYIVSRFECVHDVVISDHSKDDADRSVCRDLRKIYEQYPEDILYFVNGGDRKIGNVPEVIVCEELRIEMIYNAGGEKIQSSSWLTNGKN